VPVLDIEFDKTHKRYSIDTVDISNKITIEQEELYFHIYCHAWFFVHYKTSQFSRDLAVFLVHSCTPTVLSD